MGYPGLEQQRSSEMNLDVPVQEGWIRSCLERAGLAGKILEQMAAA